MPATPLAALSHPRRLVRRSAGLAALVLTGALGCSDASGPGRGPGGGRPTITELSPSFAPRFGEGFTLTVTGTGFVDGSTLRWRGVSRSADLVDASRLTTYVGPIELLQSDTIGVAVVSTSSPASSQSRPSAVSSSRASRSDSAYRS